ncbi:retrovirus-related pol polyprotein from transposon TNT 1-94 [Tanacetum coccineum]|uniref:Retrovirus-related pol polyprotein from transposon TNT 1-94 n=1 Tax=Tanacetum coccineum TaxID=301880 RepID=A0ABQ4ZR88_9ASTR
MTYPHPKRSFVPQAVLTRTGKIDTASANVNTAGANVNTAGASINTVNSPINIATSTPIQKEYKEKAVIDSGCSKHMIGNKCYLDEYEDYDGRFVSFGDGKGRISGKVPRKDNIYSVDLKSVVPNGDLTCLIAKAIIDESNTWHRRLGDINFKTMNKLMKGNLVKGLPLKIFQNDHSTKGREIVARRANNYLVSITKPNYKNINKNDIEDIYLLIMNGKVPDYADTGLLWSLSVFIRSTVIWERVHDFQLGIESYQQKVNLTAPTMTFPGIEDHEMFSIIYEPVHGIIYKNSKKEKQVMRHSEIYKFCNATLNIVLEDKAEYLKLFEEEIEERLKHRRQMRRWEMFMNGRPLGP